MTLTSDNKIELYAHTVFSGFPVTCTLINLMHSIVYAVARCSAVTIRYYVKMAKSIIKIRLSLAIRIILFSEWRNERRQEISTGSFLTFLMSSMSFYINVKFD